MTQNILLLFQRNRKFAPPSEPQQQFFFSAGLPQEHKIEDHMLTPRGGRSKTSNTDFIVIIIPLCTMHQSQCWMPNVHQAIGLAMLHTESIKQKNPFLNHFHIQMDVEDVVNLNQMCCSPNTETQLHTTMY